MIKKDICFKGICDVDKRSCQCNMVKFLPSGSLWDEQKLRFYSRKKTTTESSLVNFASFLGGFYYETLNSVVYPAMRENYPDTSVDSIDDWLRKYGWDYKGLEAYDFTPDGLFVREIKKINSLDTIVRSDTDLSVYSLAVKSAVLKILYNSVNLSNNFNIERFNALFNLLGVELFYSDSKPTIDCRILLPRLYLKTYDKVLLLVPLRHCGDEIKTVLFNDLIKYRDIDSFFYYEDFILDIALKLAKIVLRI